MPVSAQRRSLQGGRWHFQHGPIDMVLQCDGDVQACAFALENAWQRFTQVLPELVSELPRLRMPVALLSVNDFHHPIARRMYQATQAAAVATPDGFVTPMAAVAGSVAQEIVGCLAQPGVNRAYVNNGGDIALYLRDGMQWRMGVVSDVSMALQRMSDASSVSEQHILDGAFRVDAAQPVRGVATSGWQGRSFSLGIADSVTVLAASAAQADVAATLIANAVNLDDPRIQRRPADSVRDDTDLGARLVTVAVPPLGDRLAQQALELGLDCARGMQALGLIHAAYLCCQGQALVAEPLECWAG